MTHQAHTRSMLRNDGLVDATHPVPQLQSVDRLGVDEPDCVFPETSTTSTCTKPLTFAGTTMKRPAEIVVLQ